MTDAPSCIDVLIVGAGPVGMTLALALADGPYSVRLVDRRPLAAQAGDPRALALSHGARQLLEPLGAWPARAATPIETIHVSQKGGFGRTVMDRAEHGLPGLGYVVRYRDLASALAARLPAGSVLEESEILDISPGEDRVWVTLRQGGEVRRIAAKILVHAEGTPTDDPGVSVSDYRQHAVIAEVTPTPGHDRRAWERFTPDGPLALLPLGEEYSVVFTLPPEKADRVMALDDAGFIAALQGQFGGRIRFANPGPRSRFPLALRLRDQLADGRQVWVGNTAQTLHPVSGQGFNLGLRDARELATALLDHGPEPAALKTHAARRRLDRRGGALFTDSIVRAFSNDIPPLKLLRGLGLLALDLCPPARHFVAKRMIWGARAWP
ncbi:MAG: FAD-dependent monooxygenase [Azonexus sp.]|jgi:2-octaprenyl-6-methoxyphenol hydroxylase|nr:FAD-dependent monooxygenase [Betaproteobacteria bacterium]MBK8919172.1 FAD-dependent monooxygenase [Betaproteobacteria bacterium]MBP6037484.1 FAD-dependent monooxygenase [Azonexus sp.]MBP6908045.1 FAD-dependent monooxygenase [Azonexus sp.]